MKELKDYAKEFWLMSRKPKQIRDTGAVKLETEHFEYSDKEVVIIRFNEGGEVKEKRIDFKTENGKIKAL